MNKKGSLIIPSPQIGDVMIYSVAPSLSSFHFLMRMIDGAQISRSSAICRVEQTGHCASLYTAPFALNDEMAENLSVSTEEEMNSERKYLESSTPCQSCVLASVYILSIYLSLYFPSISLVWCLSTLTSSSLIINWTGKREEEERKKRSWDHMTWLPYPIVIPASLCLI